MNKLLVLFGISVIATLISCASGDSKTGETPESLYARGQELAKDGRSEEAIAKFQEVKNKFPHSKLATDAELAAADTSFADESYPEAQVGYQLFRDLHPKHPRVAYAIHRLAMSIYFQIPESIDRDLNLANSAIETFDELIKRFPDSEHIAEAHQKRLECLKKLAEKELYITNFYLKKQRWDSALKRAEGLLSQHQGLGYEEKALARASLAARQVGQKELSERYQAQLRQGFPQSRESEEVSKTYLSF